MTMLLEDTWSSRDVPRCPVTSTVYNMAVAEQDNGLCPPGKNSEEYA